MAQSVLRFRNYTPLDASLRAAFVVAPESETVSGVVQKPVLGDSLRLVKALEEAAKNAAKDADEVVAAPRKVNWDLKRNVAKRLRKLARETQKAVLELAELERKRRRLEEEEEEEDEEASSEESSEEEEEEEEEREN